MKSGALNVLRNMFTLDLRALALFRICLSCLLLVDLSWRLQDFFAHYTEYGIWPLRAALESDNNYSFSLYYLNSSWQFQALIFCLNIAACIMLLFGFHARVASILCFILLVSIHNRNVAITYGADKLIRCILLWAIFLPLGDTYSIDSAGKLPRNQNPRHFSVANMVFIFQILFLYFKTALAKKTKVWEDGTAIFYVLSIDQFATKFGQSLLQYPQFLELLTTGTILVQYLIPLCIVIPVYNWVFRSIAIVLITSLHVGIGASLHLGIFSCVPPIAALAIIPPTVFDSITRRFFGDLPQVNVYCRKSTSAVGKLLPCMLEFFLFGRTFFVRKAKSGAVTGAEALTRICGTSPLWRRVMSPSVPGYLKLTRLCRKVYVYPRGKKEGGCKRTRYSKGRYIAEFWFCFLLLFLVWLNYTGNSTHAVVRILGITQGWEFFTHPSTDDGWYVVPGTLDNGTILDLWNGYRSISFQKPPDVAKTFHNIRWQTFLSAMWNEGVSASLFCNFLCMKWNFLEQHKRNLVSLTVYYEVERTILRGTKPVVSVKLLDYNCTLLANGQRK